MLGFAGTAFFGLPISNCSIKIGEFRVVYPTGFLETTLLNHRINMDLLPGMMLIGLLLVLFGRFYCSWMCSAAGINRLANPLLHKVIPGKRFASMERTWKSLRENVSSRLNLGYADAISIFLGIIAGILIFDFPFLTIFNPMGVVSRSVVEFAVHHCLRFDLLLLALPLLLSLCFKNGWKTCCPDGLLQSFAACFNRILLPVVNSEACNRCTKCQNVCPVGISASMAAQETSNCLKCLQCIDICPKQAVSLSLFEKKEESCQNIQSDVSQPYSRKQVTVVHSASPKGDRGREGGAVVPIKSKDNQIGEQIRVGPF